VPSGTGGNGKGATATVTWCGCRRGESFEGCEKSARGRHLPRNATNPRTGSGMQQARDLRAEETVEVVQNHEDGTGFRGMAPSEPKHGPQGACGSGRSVACRWRGLRHPEKSGSPPRIPGEEVGNPTGATDSSLEGSQGPRVRSIPRTFGSVWSAGRRRKTSKTRWATGKVREGAGKANDPLRPRSGRRNLHRMMRISRQALKAR
jgi:hypothetical protein